MGKAIMDVNAKIAPAPPPRVTTPLLNVKQKLLLLCLTSVAAVAWWNLHAWWLYFGHAEGSPWTLLDSMFYLLLVKMALDHATASLLLFRAKEINRALPPPYFRVAMIVTKVPSEPLGMVQRTVDAMLSQDYPYPYDVWLADEDPDHETQAWCAANGVRISCRKGVEAYHRAEWPRRTRCKEGNLAFFYDHWGYEQYDVVAQFDADHVPHHDYLSTVTPAFLDDSVGYVALPSICGSNEKDNGWPVRMRLFAEGNLHGSLQASYSEEWMPCCIGSHYVVRTTHLKAAGGVGPELDEDMSTSYLINAAGFKGVFAMHTIADGEGPGTFEDSMYQDYQWARSGTVLFLRYIPPYFHKCTWRVKLRMVQIAFCWLVFSSFTVLLQIMVGVAALGAPGQSVLQLGFKLSLCQPGFLFGLQVTCASLMLSAFINHNGWMRPIDTPVVSWEAQLHLFCHRFFILKGVLHGMLSYFLGVNLNIRVTPKGPRGEKLMSQAAILPFASTAAFMAVCGLLGSSLLVFVSGLAVAHCGVCWLVLWLHYRDNHTLARFPARNFISLVTPVGAATALTGAMFWFRGFDILAAYDSYAYCGHRRLWWSYPASGAFSAGLCVLTGMALLKSRRLLDTPLRSCPQPRVGDRGRRLFK